MPRNNDPTLVHSPSVDFALPLPAPVKADDQLKAHDKMWMDLIALHLKDGGPDAIDRAESFALSLKHPDNQKEAKSILAKHHKEVGKYLAMTPLGQQVIKNRQEKTQ